MELQEADPLPPVYCWAQLGTLRSCTSPDSFLARVPWVNTRLAQGLVPGNEPLASGFVFCENQTHNQVRAAKQSLLGRLAGLLPKSPLPQELWVAPAATLAGTGDPVDKAWVQLRPPT